MPFLTRDQAFEKFKLHARNSSHFVWFLADLRFFETQNGWVFSYTQVGDVTLMALEPLIPGAPVGYAPEHHAEFERAWREVQLAVQPKITAFISVYSPFAKLLAGSGFQTVKVGQEPWVKLADCIPRGNAGKGVRSARNQAIKAGLQIEEWTAAQIQSDPAKYATLQGLLKVWKERRLVNLGGFLNSVDPFQFMDSRRYFVAVSASGRAEAFLVATPVPGIRSYFLEDMMIRPDARRGAGELLTLEAMVTLGESGAELASLGVVSMTTVETDSAHALPGPIHFVMLTLPKYLSKFYNVDGLEVFRKRFKPHIWESIHLAVRNEPSSGVSDTRAWLKVLLAMARAFKPRLQISLKWFFHEITRPFRKYPIASVMLLVPFTVFASLNRFGDLPTWALQQYGFSGAAPWREWLLRSVVSDYLYFNFAHFTAWAVAYAVIVAWAERSHSRKFLICFILLVSVFDDFVNYAVVVAPFNYFQPSVFRNLIAVKDVGGSLGLVTLLGVQLCEIRKNREILFAGLAVALVFGFAFSSAQLHSLVLNLNHFLFLALGYVVGKVRFEFERERSRQAAKGKAPVAKSVFGAGEAAEARKSSAPRRPSSRGDQTPA